MTPPEGRPPSDDRRRRGEEVLGVLHRHDGGTEVLRRLAEISPDLPELIVDFAYGDIYSRSGLSLRERQLETLAALTTLGGCESELEVHLGAALDVGLSPEEIVEALLHLLPYAGFPRVLNAMEVVRRVWSARGLR